MMDAISVEMIQLSCVTVPVFSAVRLKLIVELEEGLVRVPTAEVVTLLTLWLRTSN